MGKLWGKSAWNFTGGFQTTPLSLPSDPCMVWAMVLNRDDLTLSLLRVRCLSGWQALLWTHGHKVSSAEELPFRVWCTVYWVFVKVPRCHFILLTTNLVTGIEMYCRYTESKFGHFGLRKKYNTKRLNFSIAPRQHLPFSFMLLFTSLSYLKTKTQCAEILVFWNHL